MKSYRTIFPQLGISLLLLVGTTGLTAQEFRDGLYMIQSLSKTFDMASILQQRTSFGFDNSTCLLAAFVRDGESVIWRTRLEVGKEYALIGGGDEDATDVDIIVKNSMGTTIVADNKRDNNPLVSFVAQSSGYYSFELKLFDCSTNASYCSLAIMKKGGNIVPKGNLNTILENLYASWKNMNRRLEVSFFSARNQWCIFGAVLGHRGESGVNNISFGSANTVLMSRGDSNSDDIDLCLLNASGGELKCDEATDDRPVVVYRTYADRYYGLKIKNYDSNGRKSLILTSAMRVK